MISKVGAKKSLLGIEVNFSPCIPRFNEVERGYTGFTLSACPSVDKIVSALYLHNTRRIHFILTHLIKQIQLCRQCLKLSQKSYRSSRLESKKNQQKFPVLIKGCRPRTGRPVGISNTVSHVKYFFFKIKRMNFLQILWICNFVLFWLGIQYIYIYIYIIISMGNHGAAGVILSTQAF